MCPAHRGSSSCRVTHPGVPPSTSSSLDALFVGDAMATQSVTTGQLGPQIAPFSADAGQVVESLARLDGLEAGLVLPGHGQVWTGGVAEAVRLIRSQAGPAAA